MKTMLRLQPHHRGWTGWLLVGLLAVCTAGSALAEGPAASLADLEHRAMLLLAQRKRLELRLDGESQRIERLKGQRGPRRDGQLQSALRTAQELADRLTKLQAEFRELHGPLTAAFDRALARAARPAARKALMARKAAVLPPVPRSTARIVVDGRDNVLDGADDLEATADLLADSAEKLQRRARELRGQMVSLQRRSTLSRHARAARGDLFYEDAPRWVARVTAVPRAATSADSTPSAAASAADTAATPTTSGSSGTAEQVAVSSATAPAANPETSTSVTYSQPISGTASTASSDAIAPLGNLSTGGSTPVLQTAVDATRSVTATTSTPQQADKTTDLSPVAATTIPTSTTPSVTATSAVAFNMRSVLDPITYRELQNALRRGSPSAQLAALKKASAALDGLAKKLSSKATTLRQRAKRERATGN